MGFPSNKARAAFFAEKEAKEKGLPARSPIQGISPPKSFGGLKMPTIPIIDKPHALKTQPTGMNFSAKPPRFGRLKGIMRIK